MPAAFRRLPKSIVSWLTPQPTNADHLVGSLTASEDFVQHFADVLDALLMGRTTGDQYTKRSQHGWRGYLERAIRDNRPWNRVVQEIVLARPTSQADRGSDWFVYERSNDHQKIAEAVAPAVFGIRIECAQCHDHPLAYEIEQAHYWGLVAFFNRSKNVNTKNGPRVSESAIGGFSEFVDLDGDSNPNLLSFLQVADIEEPRPDKEAKQEDRDDLYLASHREGDPRIPKFSRRQKLAAEVVATHPLVARAMVNRVWALLLGRGLVHPFDKMDSDHQPSHPELLDRLSGDFRESGYDVKRLVQAIACSRPYSLSATRPDQVDDPASFAWYLERPLTAEQLARSIQLALRGSHEIDAQLLAGLRSKLVEVMPEENITTIKDALFLTNAPALNEFIEGSDQANHLPAKLATASGVTHQVDLLFQTIFSRHPAMDEEQAILAYLAGDLGDRSKQRVQQVIWSMLTSAEFRFNH